MSNQAFIGVMGNRKQPSGIRVYCSQGVWCPKILITTSKMHICSTSKQGNTACY